MPGILAGRDTLPAHSQLALLYAAATLNRPGPESLPRADAFAALEACDEVPRAAARSLLIELQEFDGLAVEAGKLVYELSRTAEVLETSLEERRATLAALESRGSGGPD